MSLITLPDISSGAVKKPVPNPTNWQFSALKACAKETSESIPNKYSIKDKFPPAYKQTCGNCTSNAVLACDAYYNHNPKGAWEPSTIFTYYIQRVMDGENPKKDCGSSVETGLDAVRKNGACSATVWPNSKPYSKKPSKAAYANGLKGKEITTYHQVKSLLQIKKAIYKGYPVPFAMLWAFKSIDGNTWIFTSPTKDQIDDAETGHAMVIVGYDDETQLFEVRNSWGPNWGNNGYAYIRYSDMKKLIWFDDSYAVVK